MARGINKAILVGNVGQASDVRQTADGKTITALSLATSETWKDKQTGEKQERTEWHRIVFFNQLAEIAGNYVKKGSKLYVEGSIRTRKWQDQQGIERYTTEIIANEMQMLDGKQDNATPPHPVDSYTNQGSSQATTPTNNPKPAGFELDDDVPF